jgi:hypothetical protein
MLQNIKHVSEKRGRRKRRGRRMWKGKVIIKIKR